MASTAEVQRAVASLDPADAAHRARLDASITKAFSDIDMLQARYRSSSPSFGFDARSILTEAAVLYRIARGVQASTGSPAAATLDRLRDELVQVEMDLVDALQRVGNTTVNLHVGQASNIQPLAVIYDALYDDFTAAQRQSIASTIVHYGIVPAFNGLLAPMSHGDRKWWAKNTSVNNWSTIIVGGGIMGSLALRQADYDGSFACWPGTSSATAKVTRTFRDHFDVYLPAATAFFAGAMSSLPDMGGMWDEGPGYSHDFGYPLFGAAVSLETARRDPLAAPPVFLADFASKVRQGAVSFLQMGIHFAGPSRREFTHNDGNWSFTDQALCYRLADHARQADPTSPWRTAAWRARDRAPSTWSGLHLLGYALFDWNQPLASPVGMSGFDPATIPLSHHFHGARIESSPASVARSGSNEHIAVWRQSWTDVNSTAVFFKGGDKRSDRHEHLDTGDFLFDALGVRWNADLGPPVGYPSYTPPAPFSGSTSYQTYPKRAMGQNTLVINPSRNDYLSRTVSKSWLDAVNPDQAMDDGTSSHWAPLERMDTADAAPVWSASVNLSTAYARHGIRTAAQGAPDDPRRTFVWDRASGVLEIRDTLHFAQAGNEVFWYWQLPGTSPKPVHRAENRVVLQAMRGSTPVYLDLELVSTTASAHGGFQYGRIDENLPPHQPGDALLWGYDNASWQRANLRKLALRLSTTGTSLHTTVRITPLASLTGLAETAALMQLGLLDGQTAAACHWPFNGSLDNAHGGAGLSAGGEAPAFTIGGPEGTGSVTFDGANDELRTGITLETGDTMTLAAWVKPEAGTTGILTIAANTTSGAASGFRCYINNHQTSDGALVFETANGTSQAKASTAAAAVPAGSWTHVAAVVDRPAGHVRLFVNGVLATVQSATRTDYATTGVLHLGRMAPGGSTFAFAGGMDDVRCLPRALPAAAIRALAAVGPAHRWSFHRDFNDSTRSGGAATSVNGAALSPTVTRGGAQALAIDGNDDAVNLGALNLGAAFTLSQWVRIATGRSSMQTLWFCRPAGATTGTGIHLYANTWTTTDRKLHFNTGNGTSTAAIASAAGAVPFGEWVHIAAAINRGAGTAKLYVNGAEVASGAVRSDLPDDMPMFLGSMGGGQYTQNLLGHIDEVRIDKRLLTPDEIAGLAEQPGRRPTIRSVSMLPDPPQSGQPITLTAIATEDDSVDRLRHAFAWGDGSAATPWSTSGVSPTKHYPQRTRYTATARVDDGTHLVEMPVVVDLSQPNTAPTLSAAATLAGIAGQSTAVLNVTLGDAESAGSELTLTATSGNPAMIPEAALVTGGSGFSRTLVVQVPAWAAGAVPVTLTVSDGLLAASITVSLQITNPGWGSNWSARQGDGALAWSNPAHWADGHPPLSGSSAVLRFFDGLTLPAAGLITHQDAGDPLTLSEWVLGGTGSVGEGGSLTITGNGLRMVSPDGSAPARVRLDAGAGAGFAYIVGVPVELAAATEFSGSGDASFVFAAPLTGSSSVTKSGASVLTLGGTRPHTAAGPWILQGGGLAFEPGLDQRLPASVPVRFANTAHWDLGGTSHAMSDFDVLSPGHQAELTATIANGSWSFTSAPAIQFGPVTSNTGPINNNSCIVDLSGLTQASLASSSDIAIQPKTYNTQSAASTVRLADTTTLQAKRLLVGSIAGGVHHAGTLELGQDNRIRVDEFAVGRSARASATVRHRADLTVPAETLIRAANGTSRVAKFQLGEQWGGSGDNVTSVDFSGGTIDAMVDLAEVGRATANARPSTASLTIGEEGGTFDANLLVLAMTDASASGLHTATVRQKGGTLRAGSILLGHATGNASPGVNALYQLEDGAVLRASSISAGPAGKPAGTPLRTLRFNGGTLTTADASSGLRIAGRHAADPLTLELNGATTIDVPQAQTARIEATTRLAGAGTLRKAGPGRLILSPVSPAYSGQFEVTGGSLELTGGDAALGATPDATQSNAIHLNGGTLVLNQGWQGTLTMTSAGFGHTAFPALDLGGVDGESIRTHGGVGGLTITQAGVSNHTMATIAFTAPDLPGGVQAAATATVSGGKLTGVTLTQQGSGYTVAPKVFITLSGGTSITTQPVVTPSLTIHGAIVLDPGQDANGAIPTVSVVGGGGAGTLFSASAGTTPTIALGPRRGITIGAQGGILGAIGQHRISGPLSGSGSLTKIGPGTLTLAGSTSHTGATTVAAGTLVLNSASLDDVAAVMIAPGAALELTHTTTDRVGTLILNGTPQAPGIYGSTNTQGAIRGSGTLEVAPSAYAMWTTSHFPAGSTPAHMAFTADPDHDGIPNGVEFASGGDPNAPDAAMLTPRLATDATQLRVTFRRAREAENLPLRAEAAPTPSGPWSVLTDGQSGTLIRETVDGFGPGIDRVDVILPRPNLPKWFVRLAAELP